MQTRREFLASAAALAAPLLLPGRGRADDPPPAINDTLRAIRDRLGMECDVHGTELHEVEHPTVGLVQWRWIHFRGDIGAGEFPAVTSANRELLSSMEAVHALPDSGLHQLLQEGFVEGRVQRHMAEYRDVHRELLRLHPPVSVPFAGRVYPSPAAIERRMAERDWLEKPVLHSSTFDGRTRRISLSPLARLGAGYGLHALHGIDLLAAEDPEIDRQAEAAEWSTDPAEWKKWLHTERDAHFLKLVRESKAQIVHLLLGYAHNLTDDVQASQDAGTPISHLIVTVNAVAEDERKKAAEKKMETAEVQQAAGGGME